MPSMPEPREAEVLYARHAYDFANTAESVGLARQAVRQTLSTWDCAEDVIETALLITSELAANAVMHALSSPIFTVLCALRQGTLTLGIADQDARLPRRVDFAADDDHGRGIFMVEALAANWGFEICPDGKMVFARLSAAIAPAKATAAALSGG